LKGKNFYKKYIKLTFIFILLSWMVIEVSPAKSKEYENIEKEYINLEWEVSFLYPKDWELKETGELVEIIPVEGKSFLQIYRVQFPIRASLENIPRRLGNKANLREKVVKKLSQIELSSIGADGGEVISGELLVPYGKAKVWEVYLTKGKEGFAICAYIAPHTSKKVITGFNTILESFYLGGIGSKEVAENSQEGTKNNSLQGIIPPAGVNIASKSFGSKVEGEARMDVGELEAIIDDDFSNYDRIRGFTAAFLNSPIIIELAKLYIINRIDFLLWNLDDRYYQYILEVSKDGQHWQKVADRATGQWQDWQTITFPATSAKYIKLTGLYNSSGEPYFQVVELRAFYER